MTRLAWLAAAPLLITAAVLALSFSIGEQGMLVHGSAIAGYSIGVLATFAAALRFGIRDRLGRAWLLMAVSSSLGLGQTIIFGVAYHGSGARVSMVAAIIRVAVVVVLNVTSVWSLALFSRVWNDTGLVPEWRRQATVVFVLIGVAIAGRAAVGDVMSISQGGWNWSASLASDLGDILGIAFMGPVLATALAMRGGLLLWPWALLFGETLSWLLYDACGRLPATWHMATDFGFSLLGRLFLAAAAIAHVLVMRAAHRDGEV